MESIIAAPVTGILTLIGVPVSNSRSRAVMEARIDQLSNRVERHDQMIERTYAFEERRSVIEFALSELQLHRQVEKGG